MALRFIESKPDDVRVFLRAQHLTEGNCSLHGIDEYPNWFTDIPPRYDYTAYCALITTYLFLAIAIVCDSYCVPAVEKICFKFGMSYDVAGATLMAIASSSPEFFINLYATFLTEGDMGIGTIVGSSAFNTLAITACCTFYSGANFSLDWWPITRDLIWYYISITILMLFLLDDVIYWYEALVLVFLYIIYVINLLLDRQVQKQLRNKDNPSKFICFQPRGEVLDFALMEDPDDGEGIFNFCEWPQQSRWERLIWLLSYPWECIFFLTIPNVKRSCSRSCHWFSMLMSIVWISVLTYLCSWSITAIGYHLFIPDSIMGLMFLAAGTSVPEAISSVIVTKKGYGSMAISNAIGSNTVDILICLGAPWLVKAYFMPVNSGVYAISIISHGLFYTVACLFISGLTLYMAFLITRFQLSPAVGIMCFVTYFAYISIAATIEMIFFEKSLPHCHHLI